MGPVNTYLGVISSFEHLADGYVTLDVSTTRRNKIIAIIDEILLVNSNELRSGAAASLFGKARFAMAPCFGVLGKACLQPIMQREYQRNRTDLHGPSRCDHTLIHSSLSLSPVHCVTYA